MKINVDLLATFMASSKLTSYLLNKNRTSEISSKLDGLTDENRILYNSFYAEAVKIIESCREDEETNE